MVTLDDLLVTAKQDKRVLGSLFEKYRGYLFLLSKRSLSSEIQPRMDAEDLVQATMLRAANAFHEFHGESAGQFYAWLMTIHRNTTIEELSRHSAAKRDVSRDRSLSADSNAATLYWLEPLDGEPTPSVRMMRAEQALRLATALYRLTPDQREAVRLRHLDGCSIQEIAQHLGKTEDSIAGLLKRGLEVLRHYLRA
jgi:RNA polymerase sigma-70 factor, ECF subfamily